MSGPEDRGPRLVALAREAIAAVDAAPEPPREAWLAVPAATFVTLHRGGGLRGCIGSLEARRALAEDVWRNAQAAAYRDPRFPPLAPAEREGLEVEVSLLGPRVPLQAATQAQALAALRPGVDGLVLEWGARTATFLPQVWESLPAPADFLGHLKRKAGLAADFWDGDLRLSLYTVETFR